jgi:hypothetical protein
VVTSQLTDVGLPEASSARVAGKLGVGLETDFTGKRRHNFTLVPSGAREEGTSELSLNEELCVKSERSRVEWSSWDRWVDVVSCGNRVPLEIVRNASQILWL